ncbi:MAG TPA: exodeoxyribonuclease V subunit gamma [Exilispira sp.]|nr:exodeoxyribonuclease V subunit gamma [Exilispira sp.]
MSYSIFFDYSVDDFIERIIDDYNQDVTEFSNNSLFYQNIPIFVCQSEGIKNYLFFKIAEKNKVLLNINSFNLQSFFNEYSKPYLQVAENQKVSEKIGPTSKNKIFWYLYKYFYDNISKSYNKIDTKNQDILDNPEFKKFINFLLIFSDLYEQYETFRDFDDWAILKGRDLNNVNFDILNNFYSFDEDGKIKINNQIYEDIFQIELIKLIINSPLKNTRFNILKRVKENKVKIDFPKNPIYFIGFDNIPYFYYIFLKKISEFVNINFYFLLPSASIFEKDDLSYENSYLLSFCLKKQREFIFDFLNYLSEGKDQIYQNIKNQKKFQDQKNMQIQQYLEKEDKINKDNLEQHQSLLNRYQLFLKSYENIRSKINKNFKIDDSIQILSNYTPLRELEVIKDKILDLISKDKSLKYDDIIIMAIDTNKYLPYMETVFKLQEPSLPIFIVNKDSSKDSKIKNLLDIFLEILDSNFKKTDFINFILSEIIMKKFDLEYKDIDIFNNIFSNYLWAADLEDVLSYLQKIKEKDQLNQKIEDSINLKNIEFYIEASFLANTIGFLSSNSYLEKDAYIEYKNGIIPLNTEIEGDFLEKIEKIYIIYFLLLNFYKFAKKTHKVDEYKIFFENFFDNFVLNTEEYHQEILYYRKKILDFLDEIENISEKPVLLSFDILKTVLQNHLKTYQYNAGWTVGRILFSDMISLRNVPAKVIAILGLNDSDFPRNFSSVSFDLLLQDKRSWDRDIRESDKYLFLESILSAQKYLFLSYIGKDPKNNKERAPSIALKILQEDINSRLLVEDSLKKIQMPIQPFSKSYYFEKKDYETEYKDNDKNENKEKNIDKNLSKNIDKNNIDKSIDKNIYKNNIKTYNKSWSLFFKNLLKEESKDLLTKEEEYLIKDLKDDNEIHNKSNLIDFNLFLKFIKDPLEQYLRNILNIDLYLNDYKVDNEFDQYISGLSREKIFYKLLSSELLANKIDSNEINFNRININEVDVNESNKNVINANKINVSEINKDDEINYFKVKYLKPRGILTDIDFNILKTQVDDYAKFIKNMINPTPLSCILKYVTEIKNNFISGYNIKFSYYQLIIDEKPQFLLIYFDSDKKDDKINTILCWFLNKLKGIEKLKLYKNKTQILIAKLKNADYSFNEQNLKNENDLTGILDKINNNPNIEEKINILLSSYINIILERKFIPIYLIEDNKIQDVLDGRINLKDKIENDIYNKFNQSEYFGLLNYYEKWIFNKYINSSLFYNYSSDFRQFYEAIQSIKKISENNKSN